jgi:REP element-mobilizing transposase RayT
MARGIERRRIFLDDRDREDFVGRLARLASSGAFLVYGWSLMPNHFHLLVRTGRISLSRSMRSLMTGYAGFFNRRHKRSGHLFQNRFKSIVCDEEPYILELVRYIHLNPLRAKVVKGLSELERYPYSGHSALLGKVDRPWQETGDVLGRFSRRVREARLGYGRFVAEGASHGRRPELMGGGLLRSHGGWVGVAKLRRGREAYRSDERILGSSLFVERVLEEGQRGAAVTRSKVELATLSIRICDDMSVSLEALGEGGRTEAVSRARAVLCYVWTQHLGRSGRALAQELGVSPQAVYAASKRIGEDIHLDQDDLQRWCR